MAKVRGMVYFYEGSVGRLFYPYRPPLTPPPHPTWPRCVVCCIYMEDLPILSFSYIGRLSPPSHPLILFFCTPPLSPRPLSLPQAALNMLTLTAARGLAREGILMNSVDTGWVTDMAPGGVGATAAAHETFVGPPLDDEVLRGILNGNPIDQKTFTILNSNPALSNSRILGGKFADDRVELFSWPKKLRRLAAKARFRSSVGGKKLLK